VSSVSPYKLPIAERRDELKQFLTEQGIQSEIYYPLPPYPELTPKQQEMVVKQVQAFYRP
jgi:hypothetical protein